MIAVAATFTAEPLDHPIEFWLRALEIDGALRVATYNTVIQQLLDPSGIFRQNKSGLNAVLVRFEDWLRDAPTTDTASAWARLKQNAISLANALNSAVPQSSASWIFCICPASPAWDADPARRGWQVELESLLRASVESSRIEFAGHREISAAVPVAHSYDEHGDRNGHIPYTENFFAGLGTFLVRRLGVKRIPPGKVIVVDCDNTLWQGVVGEDGAAGVKFAEPHRAFQEFLVAQIERGWLLCLCSKNSAEDVWQVFDTRPDMVLKRGHVTAVRINWLPKSENLRSLAQELNLGTDAFVFFDDNPVEISEVHAGLPEVQSLLFPTTPDAYRRFASQLWAFDARATTEEDLRRKDLYADEARRRDFRQSHTSFADFLAALQLEVTIETPGKEQRPRIAQLTHRTNQFNTTTLRLDEAQLLAALESGTECLAISVRDRFGDYGLAGVVFFKNKERSLVVDALMLSCRVLGRGVEHRILAHLGSLAMAAKLDQVSIRLTPSTRNQPAADFLNRLGANHRSKAAGNSFDFNFPAAVAMAANAQPVGEAIAVEEERPKPSDPAPATKATRTRWLERIATEMPDPQLVADLAAGALRGRPPLPQHFATPESDLERMCARIWMEVLRLREVGTLDNFH